MSTPPHNDVNIDVANDVNSQIRYQHGRRPSSADYPKLVQGPLAEPETHHGGEQLLRFGVPDPRQRFGQQQALDGDQ